MDKSIHNENIEIYGGENTLIIKNDISENVDNVSIESNNNKLDNIKNENNKIKSNQIQIHDEMIIENLIFKPIKKTENKKIITNKTNVNVYDKETINKKSINNKPKNNKSIAIIDQGVTEQLNLNGRTNTNKKKISSVSLSDIKTINDNKTIKTHTTNEDINKKSINITDENIIENLKFNKNIKKKSPKSAINSIESFAINDMGNDSYYDQSINTSEFRDNASILLSEYPSKNSVYTRDDMSYNGEPSMFNSEFVDNEDLSMLDDYKSMQNSEFFNGSVFSVKPHKSKNTLYGHTGKHPIKSESRSYLESEYIDGNDFSIISMTPSRENIKSTMNEKKFKKKLSNKSLYKKKYMNRDNISMSSNLNSEYSFNDQVSIHIDSKSILNVVDFNKVNRSKPLQTKRNPKRKSIIQPEDKSNQNSLYEEDNSIISPLSSRKNSMYSIKSRVSIINNNDIPNENKLHENDIVDNKSLGSKKKSIINSEKLSTPKVDNNEIIKIQLNDIKPVTGIIPPKKKSIPTPENKKDSLINKVPIINEPIDTIKIDIQKDNNKIIKTKPIIDKKINSKNKQKNKENIISTDNKVTDFEIKTEIITDNTQIEDTLISTETNEKINPKSKNDIKLIPKEESNSVLESKIENQKENDIKPIIENNVIEKSIIENIKPIKNKENKESSELKTIPENIIIEKNESKHNIELKSTDEIKNINDLKPVTESKIIDKKKLKDIIKVKTVSEDKKKTEKLKKKPENKIIDQNKSKDNIELQTVNENNKNNIITKTINEIKRSDDKKILPKSKIIDKKKSKDNIELKTVNENKEKDDLQKKTENTMTDKNESKATVTPKIANEIKKSDDKKISPENKIINKKKSKDNIALKTVNENKEIVDLQKKTENTMTDKNESKAIVTPKIANEIKKSDDKKISPENKIIDKKKSKDNIALQTVNENKEKDDLQKKTENTMTDKNESKAIVTPTTANEIKKSDDNKISPESKIIDKKKSKANKALKTANENKKKEELNQKFKNKMTDKNETKDIVNAKTTNDTNDMKDDDVNKNKKSLNNIDKSDKMIPINNEPISKKEIDKELPFNKKPLINNNLEEKLKEKRKIKNIENDNKIKNKTDILNTNPIMENNIKVKPSKEPKQKLVNESKVVNQIIKDIKTTDNEPIINDTIIQNFNENKKNNDIDISIAKENNPKDNEQQIYTSINKPETKNEKSIQNYTLPDTTIINDMLDIKENTESITLPEKHIKVPEIDVAVADDHKEMTQIEKEVCDNEKGQVEPPLALIDKPRASRPLNKQQSLNLNKIPIIVIHGGDSCENAADKKDKAPPAEQFVIIMQDPASKRVSIDRTTLRRDTIISIPYTPTDTPSDEAGVTSKDKPINRQSTLLKKAEEDELKVERAAKRKANKCMCYWLLLFIIFCMLVYRFSRNNRDNLAAAGSEEDGGSKVNLDSTGIDVIQGKR